MLRLLILIPVLVFALGSAIGLTAVIFFEVRGMALVVVDLGIWALLGSIGVRVGRNLISRHVESSSPDHCH